MRIICKSICEPEQLKATSEICEFVELQLYHEFDNGINDDIIDKVFKDCVANLGTAKVVTVHGPIGKVTASIEHATSEKYYPLLEGTVKLAKKFSDFYNERVGVVLHNEISSRYIDWFDFIYQGIKYVVNILTRTYPMLDIYVENVVPFRYDTQANMFDYHPNGIFDDNVKLVERLNKDVQGCNVYTLLDTAHAMISINAERRMFYNQDVNLPMYNIRDYMERYKDTIKYMHLADGIELGLKKGQHGVAFTQDRHYVLEFIMNVYKELGYNNDICLEVVEDDYIKRANFKDDFEDVYNICKKLDIQVENKITS